MYGKFEASGPVNLDRMIKEGNIPEFRCLMFQVTGVQLAKECLHLPAFAELGV